MSKTRKDREGNIRLRADGRWEVRVTIGIDYATGEERRISRYAKTQEEAIKLLHELSFIRDHTPNNFQSVTVSEWLPFCLETYMRPTLKQSTYLSYESDIRVHLNPALGNIQLKEPRNDLYTYLSVAVFFLMNAFLAVLGTFWFRTQQRRSELGLRVALGSTRVSLRKLLLGEGLILLTLAFIPAIIVGANLGFAEIVSDYPVEFTLLRFLAGMSVTYILLAITVFIAVWLPARQAMGIQPAEALHEE